MTFEIRPVTTPREMADALAVRTRVFVEEQHVPIEEEVDRYDVEPWRRSDIVHLIGALDGTVIATARLRLDAAPGELPHIQRVAVRAEHRGHGYGRAMMEALHREALARGAPGVTLAAQLHAIGFYEGLGYVGRGPVYLDAGIEHRDMDRWFDRPA